MNGCEDCNKTIRTERGIVTVDMCQMLGTCTCDDKKNTEQINKTKNAEVSRMR